MLHFDTPDTLTEVQQERWARGRRTLGEFQSLAMLKEAVMHACDTHDQWWEVQVNCDDDSLRVDGPHPVDFDEAPAHCWRLEAVLAPPVDLGVFVQLAIRFPDASLFLPEMVVEAGDCAPIQHGGDLDLVTIFEI